MDIRRGLGTSAVALAAALAASTAFADGVCDKGERDTTPAERQTMTTVLETVKKALPAAPQGWIVVGDDQVSVAQSLCKDYEDAPWQYGFGRSYQRVDDQEARNKKLEAAAAEMAADMKQKQPRVDALMAKMQKLGEQLGPAAQQGDAARIEAINKELEKVSEEYKKVLEEGDTTAKMNAAAAEAGRDLNMYISVRVNPPYDAPGHEAQKLQLANGPQNAFRWSDTHDGAKQDHALVLLGQWKPPADGRVESVPRANVATSAAHAMSVRITSDESRLMPMVNAIDFNSLTSALSQ